MLLEFVDMFNCLRITVGREVSVDDAETQPFTNAVSMHSEHLKIYFVLTFINYSYAQEVGDQSGGDYISERRCPKSCSRRQRKRI